MTKRFTTDNGSNEDVCLVDNVTGEEYEDNFEDIVDKMNKLSEENEQLFNFKENVFNLIDEKIKRGDQAIKWGENVGADVGAMGFHIALLKQLKKELLKMTENKRFEVWEQEPTKETTKSFVCTKKRFVFAHDNVGLNLKTPIMDDDKKMNIGEVLDKMNNLYEENEQLKQELRQQEMEYATEHHLAEENEQLETKNNAYLQDIEVFKEENTALKLENEQLKQKADFYKYFQKDARELEKENECLKKENYHLSVRRHDCEESLYNGMKYLKKLNEKFEKIFGISLENFLNIEYKR